MNKFFAPKEYNSIGKEELIAARKIIKSGKLSGFLAKGGKEFFGGEYVKKFENNLKNFFKVKYAITVNSWTSGLVTIFGAINLKKDDQVILSPWTMSACLTSILNFDAIPVFCDINPESFCIDPNKIEKLINKKTKAILVIDIFGQPAEIIKIKNIAKKYGIYVISDSAQAIGAKIGSNFVGTMADIGGFSLNFHKHINTGEGGVIVTNNYKLATQCYQIRNHAEKNLNSNKKFDKNLLGFNFRLTELQAAIGIEQLKKLNFLLEKKIKQSTFLSEKLSHLRGLNLPTIPKNHKHVYYMLPLRIDNKKIMISKKKIFDYLIKKKIPIGITYVDLSKFLILKKLKNFKKYNQDNLKNVKFANTKSYMGIQMWKYDFSRRELKYIVNTFEKAWEKFQIR